MEKQDARLVWRNILFQSLDSGFFMGGQVFFHQATILVAFIQRLIDSPLVVSLVPAVLFFGYNFTGLFTTRLAERSPFRKPFIAATGFVQRLFLLGMALVPFLLSPLGPAPVAFLVLFCFLGFAVMGGVYNPAWIDFCAKTIPFQYRARTVAFRAAVAGALGIAAPFLIRHILDSAAFPLNYQITILVGGALLGVSFVMFLLIREKEPSPPQERGSFGSYLRSLREVLRRDKNFARFIATQVVLSLSECGAAFFTFYAIRRFGVGDGEVVIYTLVFNASFLASGFLLGFIGDKTGNLNVLRIGALCSCLPLLLAVAPSPFMLYAVFALAGISFNARLNSFHVFVTEFGDERSLIRYSVLATAIGAASFGLAPILGGLLLEPIGIGFEALFILSAGFALLAFLSFMFVVKHPRRGTA